MMGLGAKVRFVPNSTGKIQINLTCEVGVAGASTNVRSALAMGSETSPTNGAAVTGPGSGWARTR